MTLSRGLRRALFALVVIALICVGVIAGAPIAARELTLHYLARAGVDASIGNVDINLLTGSIAYDRIKGQSEAGDGFEIGHLAASIDYPPLLSKQVSLSRLAIKAAVVDVRRTADNALRVGGITVLSPERPSSGSPSWGLALLQLTIGALRIHYSQPADDDSPAVDRELVFNNSSARDLITWENDNDVPVDANMSVNDSRIRLKGRITPFGQKLSAHFELTTENFAFDLLSPIIRNSGLKSLAGTVDSQQQIDMQYAPDTGLSVTIDGTAGWQNSRLALASGSRFASDRFNWQGRLKMQLLGGNSAPTTGDTEADHQANALHAETPGNPRPGDRNGGRQHKHRSSGSTTATDDGTRNSRDTTLAMADSLALVPLDADQGANRQVEHKKTGTQPDTIAMDAHIQAERLEISRPDGVTLTQKHGDWQGTADLTLARRATRVNTDGALKAEAMTFRAANGHSVNAAKLDWQGTTTTTLGRDMQVDSNGRLRLDMMQVAVPKGLDLNMTSLDFQGTTHTVAAKDSTRINTNGALKTKGMNTSVPGSIELGSTRLDFQGTSDTLAGKGSTKVGTDGSLAADALRFEVAGVSNFKAADVDWRGRTTVDMAQLFSRQAHGRLSAGSAHLSMPQAPVALSADRVVYNGDYAQTPNDRDDALVLRMTGAINSHEFAVMNTTIDAPWVAMRQVHGAGLAIDGIDAIALDSLEAHGVRVLGDTNSGVAVVESVGTTARQVRLDDRLHYRVKSVDMQGTTIHLRRDRNGMGVIALFVDGGKQQSGQSTSSTSAASYAFDTLALSGPAVTFTDVAVNPNVSLQGADLNLAVEDLDTAKPDRDASYRLSLDVGAYGHLDSRGKIAPLAPGGLNMNLDAWLRSLAMTPLSGYLNAAMGRQIGNGAADGTLHLEATDGQLDGNLDTTLANFRLADTPHKQTSIALGISLDTALALVRGQDDVIDFQTAILGDVTNPYFSIKNLVREAVLAGLRTAIMSDYSPLGLLNKAKNAVLDLGRSLVSKPVAFAPGKHYVLPDDRPYLGHIAQAMHEKPGLSLTVQGHAVPNDADAMSLFHGAEVDSDNRVTLQNLAKQRGQAVRDYLAARGVNPDRITLAEPMVDRDKAAAPQVTFSIGGR